MSKVSKRLCFKHIKSGMTLCILINIDEMLLNSTSEFVKQTQESKNISLYLFYNLFLLYAFNGCTTFANCIYRSFLFIELDRFGFIKPVKKASYVKRQDYTFLRQLDASGFTFRSYKLSKCGLQFIHDNHLEPLFDKCKNYFIKELHHFMYTYAKGLRSSKYHSIYGQTMRQEYQGLQEVIRLMCLPIECRSFSEDSLIMSTVENYMSGSSKDPQASAPFRLLDAWHQHCNHYNVKMPNRFKSPDSLDPRIYNNRSKFYIEYKFVNSKAHYHYHDLRQGLFVVFLPD